MTPTPDAPDTIAVHGAREHNLRGFDVAIPRDRFVVITGPSGSGKSSLAFDTIYAEGQRRYVESLSSYARQFLDQLERPDVEAIEGLSPAISIEQKTISRSPRSTVGTATEIADYLRLLFARVGRPHCTGCGRPIARQTAEQMAERVLALPEGARVQLMAPVVRGRKGAYKKELDGYRRRGFVRVRVDGTLHDLAEPLELARHVRHDIDLVVDRVVVKPTAGPRLHESLRTALELGDGLVKVHVAQHAGANEAEWLLSQTNACADCGISFPEIAPRLFSFNNPHGACPECSGLGVRGELDAELVVPDPSLALGRAIEPWKGRGRRHYKDVLSSLAAHFDVDLDTPWEALPAPVRRAILHGTGRAPVRFEFSRRGSSESFEQPWTGVLAELERLGGEDESEHKRLAPYRVERPCTACSGSRLGPIARHVWIEGRSIDALSRLPVAELAAFLDDLALEGREAEIARRVVKEIRERLRFLCDVGLGYLSLDRASPTLSGGEGQRIRLATQIGASLMGVLYILDEPSIGLHARDHGRLLDSLLALRDMGNSVLVVEHDEATIRRADHVIDMGPGAGIHGGHVVAEGDPESLARNTRSPTGAYLAGRRAIPVPRRRRPTDGPALVLRGCTGRNLKDVDLRIPTGCLTVVTGVSGSGKSTLVNDTLHRALARKLHGARQPASPFRALEGDELVDKVIDVDQAPIGRTPRSNPATYSGAFSPIRNLFAQVPEARMRGYGPGRFSFNVKGGRCEACQGDGSLRVEMHFLPDLFVTCQTCGGHRYNRETLEISYKGASIADVLAMTVEEALTLFENAGPVRRPLQSLHDVGLDYIGLGQPSNTLSGGEAQRIKLARELARKSSGRTLYLLDEPTTGLHFADVEKLLEQLERLVDRGNTVVVIEHHLDVVKTADLVVDLGPEGGEEGGRIVAAGTPEAVARSDASHTGRALRAVLP